MAKIHKILVLVCVSAIVLGFFLPWAQVESKQVGAITKALTGKRQESVDAISGFKIPIMANSDESRLAMSVIKIFNPGVENADKKSFLVWLIPILGLVILGLTFSLETNRWVNLAIAILGIAIFAVALYKIKTTDLDKLILQIKIGIGLWMILWGYLISGIAGAARFVLLLKKS
jgi:hypothetical protein